MRKTIKALLLAALTIGVVAGCDWGESSASSSQESSSQSTGASTSESSKTSTTSSIESSSTSTSSTISIPPSLTGITLNTANVKKEYNYGDALDLTGLVVTAKYSDNTTANVTDYTTDPVNGSALRNFGVKEVTVTYQGFSEKFNVTVNATIMNIALNTNNVKKEYKAGETLDLTGLVVNANYNDNSRKTVTDYTTNPVNGTVLETIGEQKIVVTYQTKTAEFTVNVAPAKKAAWTEEEAKIMSDNLYGIVLPYTGFEESVVTYDAQKESLFIQGGTLASDSLVNYAKLMVAAGFTSLTETAYIYQKAVSTAQGTRYVRVGFQSNEGQFYLQALDPYYYEFPTVFAEAYASQVIGSEEIAPALPGADYYEFNTTYRVIFCYMNSTTDDAGYSAILETAHWKVQAEKDEYNYYVAIAPDYSYQVSYIYQQDLGRLAIYFELITKWQADFFNEFFQKNSPCVIDIPEYEGANVTYLFMISGTNALVGVNNSSADEVKAYAEKVANAGWEVNYNESYEMYKAKLTIANVGVANMTFYFNPQNGAAIIIVDSKFDPLPTATFPSEEIAELLGEDITDVVPAYEGTATGYAVTEEGTNYIITVQVEKGTEKAAAAAYLEYIQTKGYALEEGYSTIYVSQNKQIYIQSNGIADSGEFTITFWPVPYTLDWPTNKIAKYLGEDIDTIVPAFENEDIENYEFEADEDGIWILINFDYDADVDVDEMINAYIEVLQGSKYFFMMEDEDEVMYYVSPDLKVVVGVQNDGGDMWIYINTVEALTAGQWPTYHLQYYFALKGYTDELPAYEGEFVSANATIGTSSLTIDVVLDTGDVEEMKAEADAYIKTLEDEGFEFLLELGEGACKAYTSPNKQYEVSVMYQPNGFTVQIDEIANESKETTTFPTEELFQEHPELEGALPVVVDGDATFKTQIQSDWVEIYVMYEDTTLIADAKKAYEAALVEAGFIPQEDTAGYDLVYFSPDGTYYVCVTDWSSYDPAGFDIEIYYL